MPHQEPSPSDPSLVDNQVAYLQLHNAKQGCFSCRVDRA